MKQEITFNGPAILKERPGVTVDNSLKDNYEKALSSPFIKRKMEQAEAFIAKHGLPDMKKYTKRKMLNNISG